MSSEDRFSGRNDGACESENYPCCSVERALCGLLLTNECSKPITIKSALKGQLTSSNFSSRRDSTASDGGNGLDSEIHTQSSGGNFMTYNVCFMDFSVWRRYSDFESLRNYLRNTYPTCIVPPIPEKHSISSYATLKKSSREGGFMIEKRKRMFTTFLMRIARHPILVKDHLFHRFLESDIPWIDITSADNIPKKSKFSSLSSKPKIPDPKFAEVDIETSKEGLLLAQLQKTHKSTTSKYKKLANNYMDLGMAFNGFSLEDKDNVELFEKIGIAIDTTHASLAELAAMYEEDFSDSIQEFVQYSSCVKTTLRHRFQKQSEYEAVCDQIVGKKLQLLNLETSTSKKASLMSSILDNDPSQTKKNSIAKTKDLIQELESNKSDLFNVLGKMSEEVEAELKRFDAEKLNEWKSFIFSYVQHHIQMHEENLTLWEDTVSGIETVAEKVY